MSPFDRIFGRGRAVENLLKKANVAFGKGDWETSAQLAGDLRERIDPEKPGKYSQELMRAFYLEASSFANMEKQDVALDIITEALKQDEGLGNIAQLLVDIASKSDDPRVLEVLEQVYKQIPDNNFVALELADKYVTAERFDEKAVALFKKIYQRVPDNKKVIYGLAMGLRKQEKFDRTTLAIYRRAFHDNSTNNDFLYALARTYASQVPPVTEALPVIERALKFFKDETAFTEAKIAILASLPALTPDQVKILLERYKKTKDPDLAKQLINHLLAAHADDQDACSVYEAVWRGHPKKTTLLSILAERYRLSGRRDAVAIDIYQSFFDEMPRERENSLYLSRRYAEKNDHSEKAILVYQQTLRDMPSGDVDDVVIALAIAYLKSSRKDEESARIFRMAHEIDSANYSYLVALRDVAMDGGRMDGPRAKPLIEFIKHPDTKAQDAKSLGKLLGPVLAAEDRVDRNASDIYRLNITNKMASKEEESLFTKYLISTGEAKIGDLPLLERVFSREESDDLASLLTRLYRQTGAPDEQRLNKIIRALKKDPSDRELALWALPYILNSHGENAELFPLLSELIKQGHLSGSTGIKPGVVERTATRISRDRIREGKFEEAITILIEAFKKEKDPILQYLLGVSYQGTGDTRTGLGIFKNLIKNDRQNPAYSYRIAVLNMLGGDLKSAVKELEALAAKYPDHPMVCLRMGLINESNGEIDAAEAEYLKIKSGDKNVIAFASYRRGIIECSRDNWKEGLKLLETAAGGGLKTNILQDARMLARLTLVDTGLKNESLDSAERRLNKLTQEKRPPWLGATVERMLRLALLHFKKGDEKTARRVLENAEATGVLDSRVSSLIAMLDITSGRPKAAIERMERALGYRDKSGLKLAHRLWTIIALRLGRHEDARDAAEWLMVRKQPGAARLRFLGVWRNPVEVDWPAVLEGYTYDDLGNEFGFPVGLVGRMAYKCADYDGGAKFLEKYFKDKTNPDRIEAEFLLGLMYIKLKKPNLGLHYWSHILEEGYKELKGKQRADGLILLGYHFLEHGETEKSREAFKLAGDTGAAKEDISRGVAYSHLQAGFLAAKSDNMLGAVREWEKILETNPNNWQAIQNLGLAHIWLDNLGIALEQFETLFTICQDTPELIDQEYQSFIFEETRKMINQLVNIRGTEASRGEVKTEMLLDDIKASNRHYWTLGVKKGVTVEEAQAQYFRLLKIYNPEKYPQDFMILEKAYDFFSKPGLLRKNEQVVFNAFHFRQLSAVETGGLSEIPPSPLIIEHLKKELDPRNHIDYDQLLNDSMETKESLPQLNLSPDFNVPDYLASW